MLVLSVSLQQQQQNFPVRGMYLRIFYIFFSVAALWDPFIYFFFLIKSISMHWEELWQVCIMKFQKLFINSYTSSWTSRSALSRGSVEEVLLPWHLIHNTESKNHRMVEVERGLWRSSCPQHPYSSKTT